MPDLVTVTQRDAIAEIAINRPEKRNAINWDVMLGLEAAITAAERLPGARAILLRGEGLGFSAGIDLMGFSQSQEHFGDGWRENLLPVTQAYQSILNRYEQSKLPTIALLHGFAFGLGCELALACDIRIAAEGARIGLTETRLGLIPDVGGTTRLTRLVGPARAKELIMTGREFDLDAAERWGIVNRVVPEANLLAAGEALALEIAQAAPLAVSYAKQVIDGFASIERGLKLEAWAQNLLVKTEDFEAGAQAAMTKQAPEWKGK